MDPFLGEIRMFVGNFAPQGWLLCNGQSLPVAQNQALFSIIGTYYGGDGINNFKLPNLTHLSPVQYAGNEKPGITGGSASVALTAANLPQHTHAVTDPGHTHGVAVPAHAHSFAVPCDATAYGSSPAPTVSSPVGAYLSNTSAIDTNINTATGASVPASGLYTKGIVTGTMAPANTGNSSAVTGTSASSVTSISILSGGSVNPTPVTFVPPYVTCSFIIAVEGIYPTRP